MNMRRHGWQRPLHPLQMVGMAVYSFLVVTFYTFLGLFLGNRIAEITVTSIFSFVALLIMFLFIRCTAIDPTDKTSFRKKKRAKSNGFAKLDYGYILRQAVVRFFRRIERKILTTFIRRKYLDPLKTSTQLEPLLPFPLLMKDDAISPDLKEDDISFCSLCDFQVKKHSKHCRTCNRCVDGFDHHCRWLNNCVGKRNYTTFILLMVFVLLMLIIEGGTAIAIFIRCFVDKKGIEQELERRLYVELPREVLATISVFLVLMTAYSTAAMGQLFFFHVVLIRKVYETLLLRSYRKIEDIHSFYPRTPTQGFRLFFEGMRTYDYILAMKEQNQFPELDDSDFSSDDSSDYDSPERSTLASRFICRRHRNQNPAALSIRIDKSSEPPKKQGFRVSIDPWKLIKLSREKALLAAEKARERLKKQKPVPEHDSLRPLPLETKHGPLMNPDRNLAATGSVDPWKLIKLSREKALLAAEKARERLKKQKPVPEHDSLRPLPLETKHGPLMNPDRNLAATGSVSTPLISIGKLTGSPGRFSSPRRRFSGSPTRRLSGVVPSPKHKYRSSFDLKLTEVSRELETYISRQVLCSVIKKDGTAPSPK